MGSGQGPQSPSPAPASGLCPGVPPPSVTAWYVLTAGHAGGRPPAAVGTSWRRLRTGALRAHGCVSPRAPFAGELWPLPWLSGRCRVLAATLVGTPRQGSRRPSVSCIAPAGVLEFGEHPRPTSLVCCGLARRVRDPEPGHGHVRRGARCACAGRVSSRRRTALLPGDGSRCRSPCRCGPGLAGGGPRAPGWRAGVRPSFVCMLVFLSQRTSPAGATPSGVPGLRRTGPGTVGTGRLGQEGKVGTRKEEGGRGGFRATCGRGAASRGATWLPAAAVSTSSPPALLVFRTVAGAGRPCRSPLHLLANVPGVVGTVSAVTLLVRNGLLCWVAGAPAGGGSRWGSGRSQSLPWGWRSASCQPFSGLAPGPHLHSLRTWRPRAPFSQVWPAWAAPTEGPAPALPQTVGRPVGARWPCRSQMSEPLGGLAGSSGMSSAWAWLCRQGSLCGLPPLAGAAPGSPGTPQVPALQCCLLGHV